jgi:Holliday junction DNA helicase RuvA
MYYSLTGTVAAVFPPDLLVLQVGDVGYEITFPNISSLTLNQPLVVYTRLIIHENEHFLVGFQTLKEKDLFVTLLTVKGVGPKTAVNIISGTTPDEFIGAVESENTAFLKRLPGIGMKVASQIVLDLKGKLQMSSKLETKSYTRVADALRGLGFKNKEIDIAIASLPAASPLPEDQLIRLALQALKRG